MVRVDQLVQDDGRVFEHVVSLQKRRRARNVHLFRQACIVAPLSEPIDARVVGPRFHIDIGMVVLDPDPQLAHLLKAVFWHQDGDALQMIGQHGQRPGSRLGVLALEHLGVHINGPAFDVLDHGIEMGFLWCFFLCIRFGVGRLLRQNLPLVVAVVGPCVPGPLARGTDSVAVVRASPR